MNVDRIRGGKKGSPLDENVTGTKLVKSGVLLNKRVVLRHGRTARDRSGTGNGDAIVASTAEDGVGTMMVVN